MAAVLRERSLRYLRRSSVRWQRRYEGWEGWRTERTVDPTPVPDEVSSEDYRNSR